MLDRALPGIQALKHVVVLMMENRSFDHMLGALHATIPAIDGLTGNETNLDTTGVPVTVVAECRVPEPARSRSRSSLSCRRSSDLRRRHHRAESRTAQPNMQGFVKSYFNQQAQHRPLPRDHELLHAGQAACAHRAGEGVRRLQPLVLVHPRPHALQSRLRPLRHLVRPGQHGRLLLEQAVQEHLRASCRRGNIRHGSITSTQASSSLEVVNLLQNQPALFGTFQDFLDACSRNKLPQYSFIEPNYTDHDAPDGSGELIANDQHPGPRRSRRRTVHRHRLQRHSQQPESLAEHSNPDRLRRARRHLRPRPAAVLHARRLRSPAQRHRDARRFPLRPPRRSRARRPHLALGAPGTVINEVFEHASIPGTITEYFIGACDHAFAPGESSQ